MLKFLTTGEKCEKKKICCLEVLAGDAVLSKKNMAAAAELHLRKPQDFRNNVLWINKTKVEMSDHNAE